MITSRTQWQRRRYRTVERTIGYAAVSPGGRRRSSTDEHSVHKYHATRRVRLRASQEQIEDSPGHRSIMPGAAKFQASVMQTGSIRRSSARCASVTATMWRLCAWGSLSSLTTLLLLCDGRIPHCKVVLVAAIDSVWVSSASSTRSSGCSRLRLLCGCGGLSI